MGSRMRSPHLLSFDSRDGVYLDHVLMKTSVYPSNILFQQKHCPNGKLTYGNLGLRGKCRKNTPEYQGSQSCWCIVRLLMKTLNLGMGLTTETACELAPS